MLRNVKFISRVEQDISFVRFAHSWNIHLVIRNIFHITAHPCTILYLYIVLTYNVTSLDFSIEFFNRNKDDELFEI